jgi:hypothetical protein
MPEPTSQESAINLEISKPEVLWRSFTIDPRELSVDMFRQPLVPGKPSGDDPTKLSDGNELGVYMSTNRDMT